MKYFYGTGRSFMDKEQAAFSFDLNESLYFRQGEEVGEMVSISLEPIISLQQQPEYVQLRGVIELKGEYRRDDEGHTDYIQIDEDERQAVRHIEEVNEIGENELVFLHHFPIEISIPEERIKDLNEIKVQVATFDYLFPANDRMSLQATVEILGIMPEEERVQSAVEQQELPLPFFGADEDGADSLEELMKRIASFDEQLPQFDFEIIPEQEEAIAEREAAVEEQETASNIKRENAARRPFPEALQPENVAAERTQDENEQAKAEAKQPETCSDRKEQEAAEQALSAEAEITCEARETEETSERELQQSLSSHESTAAVETESAAEENPVPKESTAPEPTANGEQEQFAKTAANLNAVRSKEQAESNEQQPSAEENYRIEENEDEPLEQAAGAINTSGIINQESLENRSEEQSENAVQQQAAEPDAKSNESCIQEPVAERSSASSEEVGKEPVGERTQEEAVSVNAEPTVERETQDVSSEESKSPSAEKSAEQSSRKERTPSPESANKEQNEQQTPVRKKRTEAGIHAQQPEEGGADLGNLTDLFGNEKEEGYTSMRLYIVQERDTIDTIADRYEIPVSRLLQHNRLDSDNIGAGQLIYIPVLREANT